MTTDAPWTIEPKPCPFCGTEPLTDPDGEGMKSDVDGEAYFCVSCADCIAYGPSRPTEAGSIDAWNDRAPISSVTGRILPCPFCGSPAGLKSHDHLGMSEDPSVHCSVHCPRCESWLGFCGSESETLAIWNRRIGPKRMVPETNPAAR